MAEQNSELGDQPQAIVEQKGDLLVNNEQQKLREELVNEALFGRSLFKITSEREKEGYTQFTNTKMIPKDYLEALMNPSEDTQITEDDVRKTKQASFGVALELSAQITEVRLAQGGPVREDPDSLKALVMSIRKGDQLGREYYGTDSHIIIDEARKAVSRRLGKPPDQVNWDDKQLLSWANEQFQKANMRISGSFDAASNVHSY